mmetsp:Transcript_40920/g.73538  ORF Transcript_40920/g.73538 Transcript_40920/m.73538 type:complete len:317 (+) Transcript_40920:75-1025(+)
MFPFLQLLGTMLWCVGYGLLAFWMLLICGLLCDPPKRKPSSDDPCDCDCYDLKLTMWLITLFVLSMMVMILFFLLRAPVRILFWMLLAAGVCMFAGMIVFARKASPRPLRPRPAPLIGVRQLLQSESSEADEIRDLVTKQCEKYTSKYGFSLTVEEIYKVNLQDQRQPSSDEQQQQLQACNSHIQRLFHGTSTDNMQSIIFNGFKLPSKSGMFGKGIYFAGAPQKSWSYSNGWQSRYLLVVDVALGNMKQQSSPKCIDPDKDFQRSWLMRFRGARNFNSVVAVTCEHGGSVNVPEYVVYNPHQAVVRYVVKCGKVC